MTRRVREATADDFGAVSGLYRQLQPDDPVVDDGRDRQVFATICASQGLHLFVLEFEGQIRATAYLNIIPNVTRSAAPYAVIENVVVDHRHRGRGIGKQIMEHVLARAWEDGCYKAMLMTGSTRESTRALYRACGFSGADKVAYVARPPVDRI